MSENNSPGKNWRVILTLALSALGVGFYFIQALFLCVIWVLLKINPGFNLLGDLHISLFLWAFILCGVLLIPLLVLSIYELQEKPAPVWLDLNKSIPSRIVGLSILVWPCVVLLGWWIAGHDNLAPMWLGAINVLVVGLPILWIFHIAQNKLPGGSQVRKWRIFGFSITIMPMVVILFELIAVVILGVLGFLWISLRFADVPHFEQAVTSLFDQIMLYGDDLEGILSLMKSFILQPSVIFWGLAVIGGIMPMIEEIFKPLAFWSLAGRKITYSEGFVGGLLCGAGFALIENIFYFTNVSMAEDWVFMAIGRAGTGVLHMLASALMGWGLAAAWSKGKAVFTIITTVSAFLLHGIWNIIAVVSGLVPVLILEKEPTLAQMLLSLVPIFFLLMLSLTGLFLINRYLRKTPQYHTTNTDNIMIKNVANT